jgi:hypothetical protein
MASPGTHRILIYCIITSVGILSDTPTRTEHLTSINMAEVPFLVMKITSNELLGWGLLCVIL